MAIDSPFLHTSAYGAATLLDIRGVRMAEHFGGGPAAEYRAARESTALFDRSDRGLLVVRGQDRLAWLHNLVTNAVKTLDAGAGNYAFAIDVKGRVLFDLNILNRDDALWLDIDHAALARAAAHLDRYLITEDVQISDVTADHARLGVAGPGSPAIAARLGIGNHVAMASLSSAPLGASGVRLIRHDFAGLPGFELIMPRELAVEWWENLHGDCSVQAAGHAALDVLRIEAGIPWLGRDIDERTIPPETGQIERGISYHKGCYLGQEVIERMRSHGVLPRVLRRARMQDGSGLTLPSPIRRAGSEVGRVTSMVVHPEGGHWTGLGYVRTSLEDLTGLTTGDPERKLQVLP